MTLTPIEQQSAVWKKLSSHMAARLDELRRKNDGDASEVETARTRGRIAQLKELLALADAEPAYGGATDDAAPMGARIAGIVQE